MFTGIIEQLGKVVDKQNGKLTISTEKKLLQKLKTGSSISINGICLTVTEFSNTDFSIDFMPETEKKTNIGTLSKRDLVNLELPATPDTLLSGHIVQGHVDGVGKILKITKDGNSSIFTFTGDKKLLKYLVPKGSVAINGISLTVIDIGKNYFTIGIIPHTWMKTMLHKAKIDDLVNIEIDVLAKYIEKLVNK